MRNRGVEIFMLNYTENPESGQLDYRSLLYNSGMTKRNHQEALMKIHKRFSEDSSNFDKLSIIQLLHAAFLVVQQLAHGFPVLQAFKSSCVDVYLKARFIYDNETKLRLTSIIEDTISMDFDIEEDDDYILDLDAATCSISNLQDNSKLTLIRQQGLLMDWCVKEYLWTERQFSDSEAQVSLKMNFIDDFFNLDNKFSSKEVLDILPFILLNFYEHSASNDVSIRKVWTSNVLTQSPNLQFLDKKNLILAKDILTFDYEGYDENMPWGKDFDKANNLALLLYFEVFLMNSDMESNWTIDNSSNSITVAQFSEAHRSNKLTVQLDSQENQFFITNYIELLSHVKTCIYIILRKADNVIDDVDYVTLRHGLKWYSRFCDLGRMILINKNAENIFQNEDEVVLLLKVHYNWLKKFIINLTDNYEAHSSTNFEEYHKPALEEILKKIDSSLTSVDNPFRKICKLYKKHVETPQPRTSNLVLDIFSQLQNVTESLTPFKSRYISKNLINEKKFKTFQKEETLKIRSLLTSLWQKIYLNETLDTEVKDVLHNIQEFCDLYLNITKSESRDGDDFEFKDETLSSKEIEKMTVKVQMWPLHEYMFILFVERLQRELCEKLSAKENCDSLPSSYPSSYHMEIPNIPIELHAVLNAISILQDKPDERKRLIFALFTWFSKFSENSYAIKNFKLV